MKKVCLLVTNALPWKDKTLSTAADVIYVWRNTIIIAFGLESALENEIILYFTAS